MTRGGGKAFVYTGPFVTGSGGPPRTFIDLSSWGTFTRASYATYMAGAFGSGSAQFIRDAARDVRRFEDRGDGNGRMLLLEGARKNWFTDSETFASWSAGSATITNNYGSAPDGTTTADRLQVASGGTGANLSFSGITPSIDWVGTLYRRSPTGTVSAQDLIGASSVWPSANNALGTTYERAVCAALPSNSSTSVGMWVGDARDWSAFGGTTAAARDELTWGRQLEQASFPSSYIRSAAVGGTTRSADILSGATSSVPSAMINGAFTFDIAPIFSSSAGVRHAADQCIFSFAEDDSERVFFVVSGGSIYIRVTSGGATKVTSNALTFSAHQKISVAIDGAAGSITVGGATTGNGTVTGTPWTRTTGSTTYVGSRQGGTQPLFARLGPYSAAFSTTKIVLLLLGQSNMQVNNITDKIWSEVQKTYPLAKKVEYCVGGTTLYVDWAKAGGAQYAGAVSTWNAAYAADPDLANCTPIIVWGQGETDASNNTYAAAYGTNLPAFFANFESDVPFFAGCKKVIHMLWPSNGLEYPSSTNNTTIRAAQTAYQAAHPTIVSTTETSDLTTYDTIHFDDASTTTIAQRDAAIVRGWIG